MLLHLLLFFLALGGFVRSFELRDETDYGEMKRKVPFLPDTNVFGDRMTEEYSDESECSSPRRLFKCVRNQLRMDNRMRTGENFSGAENIFGNDCSSEIALRECRKQLGNHNHLSLVSLITDQALLISCFDDRYVFSGHCIKRTLSLRKADLQKCTVWMDGRQRSREKTCWMREKYVDCVRSIIGEDCGKLASEAICEIANNVAKLSSPHRRCNIHCSTPMSSFGFSHRIAAESNLTPQCDPEGGEDCECDCDLDKFKECGDGFKKELHIEASSAIEVVAKVLQIMDRHRKEGFEAICRAGKHFNECGGTETEKCFDIITLMSKMKLPYDQAMSVSVTAFIFNYECPRQAFHDNFDCFYGVTVEQEQKLIVCYWKFIIELKKSKCPCKASQLYLDCLTPYFAESCGDEPAQAVCDVERAVLREYVPEADLCRMRCGAE